jgi:hypothetical protein
MYNPQYPVIYRVNKYVRNNGEYQRRDRHWKLPAAKQLFQVDFFAEEAQKKERQYSQYHFKNI